MQHKTYRASAILIIIEFFLIFAPLTILGAAINWPESLSEPARVNLPLILEQANAVNLGYFLYMIYSVLIIPVAYVIYRALRRENQANTLLQIGLGFAIGSAVLRVLGIIRWLIPMPLLAQQFVDPATSDATRETISIVYDMLNAYAGSVGEVLGVGLFAALWIGITSVALLQNHALPRWVGIFGLIAAVLLTAGLLEIVGIDAGFLLTFNVVVLHFWWLTVALFMLFRPQYLGENLGTTS